MNKKFKTIFTFAVSSLMLFFFFFSGGNVGDDNDDLLKNFSLENDSNLESGGSSRFFVSFNDQYLNNEDVTYSIIKSNGDVYLEDDTGTNDFKEEDLKESIQELFKIYDKEFTK